MKTRYSRHVWAGSELWAVALAPLGTLLAVESWWRHRRGTVAWKRRTLIHEEMA